MNNKVKYWLETSEYDLDTAKAMLDTPDGISMSALHVI